MESGIQPPSGPAPQPVSEQVLWEGSPSQWQNVGFYLLMLLLALVIVPILWLWKSSPSHPQNSGLYLMIFAGWMILPLTFFIARWVETRSRRMTISNQRLRLRTGVFNRKTEDLELYRVKDLSLEEPFWDRMVGMSNIRVYSTDISTSFIELRGLKNGASIYEQLRAAVEARRASRRVGITELE